jgi:hypothetical protein
MQKMIILVAALVFSVAVQAQTPKSEPQPKAATGATAPEKFDAKWRFLVGEWSGEAGGEPGSGRMSCSFRFDLHEHVLVRRSQTAFAASGGTPAGVHDDLMVIYPAAEDDQPRAVYFDSQGHTIDYASLVWSADGDDLTFVSKASPASPRFRLAYKKIDAQTISTSFEIAPPGGSVAFKQHVWGRLRRIERK